MVKHICDDFRDRAKPFNKNNSKTEISSRGEQELMPDGVTASGVPARMVSWSD
jgi:hypothetical protein